MLYVINFDSGYCGNAVASAIYPGTYFLNERNPNMAHLSEIDVGRLKLMKSFDDSYIPYLEFCESKYKSIPCHQVHLYPLYKDELNEKFKDRIVHIYITTKYDYLQKWASARLKTLYGGKKWYEDRGEKDLNPVFDTYFENKIELADILNGDLGKALKPWIDSNELHLDLYYEWLKKIKVPLANI